MEKQTISISVIYAGLNAQQEYQLELPENSTVEQALAASQVLVDFPEIDFYNGYAVGVFSKKTALNRVLIAGDRVEVYRPLTADPKERRRRQVQQNRQLTNAKGGWLGK